MSPSTKKSEQRWALKWAIVMVGLTCLPYLFAWRLAPAGTQYTGLLVNPLDGESYYAKMQQGARGEWLFHLPFTSEPHDGAAVYLFYLALGHLSGLTGLSIPLTYHLARVVTGIFFLLVAYRFIALFFRNVATRRMAFVLLGLSAGLGWLLAPLGVTTADLWVAEGFSFLSILTNPHFPLAMGLMLLIFVEILQSAPLGPPGEQSASGRPRSLRMLAAAGLGLLLSLVQPFAVPVTLVILAVYLALLAWRDRSMPWSAMVYTSSAAVGALPVMLYDLYVYRANPALAAWSLQNVTPSLPPWNYALAYGLILLLALGGMGLSLRRREPSDLLLLAWVGSTAVLLYVPFALQRRFITGLHVPLVLLATLALQQLVWPRLGARRRTIVNGLLVGAASLTNLLIPIAAVIGVAQGQPPLVMSSDEAAACAWLRDHTAWTDTVLAPPESGQFIPAWAGNRVVYGHPFETIEAKVKEAQVTAFYDAQATEEDRRSLLNQYGVRYVLVPTESHLDPAGLDMVPAWTGEQAVVYRVGGTP